MHNKKSKPRLIKSAYLLLSLNLVFATSNVMAFSTKKQHVMSILGFSKIKSFNNNPNSYENPINGSWTLGYSDVNIKVYYQKFNCDGKDSYKLWIVNLTKSEFKISYQFWKTSTAKTIELTPFANLEGICASGYDYKLIETIPLDKKNQQVKLTINYLK